jgi:hypothetical protein
MPNLKQKSVFFFGANLNVDCLLLRVCVCVLSIMGQVLRITLMVGIQLQFMPLVGLAIFRHQSPHFWKICIYFILILLTEGCTRVLTSGKFVFILS